MHLFLSHIEEHANTAFYTIVLWSQQTIHPHREQIFLKAAKKKSHT